MAEIIEEPSALSKIIPVSFKINDTDSVTTTRLATKKQFNTTDTDAWLSFTLDGIDANMTGEFDLTMVNVDENPSSIINRTNLPFSAIPFHYKIDASADVEKNQIRHAGRWIGQVIIRLANGDTTTRQFDFAIVGHLLDGKEARLILIEDYNALMATITTSKDELAQYNIDYAALIETVTTQEAARVQAELTRAQTFDALVESEMIAQNVATKLTEKEATFAPRMLSVEQQLEQAATKTELQAVASGSPKAVYATLALLQAAYPTGTTGTYLVTADGNWYYWSGSAWSIGGQYQTSLSLVDKLGSSSAMTLTQYALTKELGLGFTISGGFIKPNGEFNSGEGRSATNFIRISREKNITFKAESNNEYVAAIAFYDGNKKFISSVSNNLTPIAEQTILASNIPANAEYVRLSTTDDILSTSYVMFGDGVQGIIQASEQKTLGVTNTLDLEIQKRLPVRHGKNLFDKTAILSGYYLDDLGGLSAFASYFTSDYILVDPLTTYALKDIAYGGNAPGSAYVYYDISKKVISGFYGNSIVDQKITTPANCYFVRMCGFLSLLDSAQVELGEVPTTYENYTEYKPIGDVIGQVPSREVITILPDKMYFAKNKQATVYYENVLLKNLADATSLYFDKGTNYNRQVAFKFDTAAANQTMIAQIARSLKKGETKTIGYDVIDPVVNNGKTTNILFVGDSFTDGGTFVKETKALLNADGVTVNLIGTCGDSTVKAEGSSGGTLQNTFLDASAGVARIVDITGVTVAPSSTYPGRIYRDANGTDWIIRGSKIDGSGNGKMVVTKYQATNADFATFPESGTLTKQNSGEGDAVINYTNPTPSYYNPFINPSGQLDITNYITTWGFSAPDIVNLEFTWNDIDPWASENALTSVANNFKTAVDHIHGAYPNAKIIITIAPCGSINGNKDWNGKKYSVLSLVELLLVKFEDDAAYNAWVKLAPAYAFVDLIYGYATNTVTPSERYAVTEQSGGDGTHPATVGMNQIADCLYPIVHKLIL